MQLEEMKMGFFGYQKSAVQQYLANQEAEFSKQLQEKDAQAEQAVQQAKKRIEELEQASADNWARVHRLEQELQSLQAELDGLRQSILAGSTQELPEARALCEAICRRAKEDALPSLRPVINGTGVVLHTNLGRACLSQRAADAVTATNQEDGVALALARYIPGVAEQLARQGYGWD